MIVVPDIFELTPQNTIVIIPPAGSVVGQSETYNLIVKLEFEANSKINLFWELTIINRGFYRFGNMQSVWLGADEVALSDKRISIPFVIQNIDNINENTPALEIQLGVFEEESGSGNQKFDLASIAVDYRLTTVLKIKMIS